MSELGKVRSIKLVEVSVAIFAIFVLFYYKSRNKILFC